MGSFYTVLCEVLAYKIEFEGRSYAKGDYALMPKHMAKQYKDAVRILTREEQLLKEKEW